MAGEKRSQDKDEIVHATAILVDIEGTTTSISFVKDVLFPYVRQNLKNYIKTKWEEEEFKQDYEKLKEQAKKDSEDKLDGFVAITTGDKLEEQKESLLNNVLWQMDNDRKTGALKQLQGHMWREAYNTGAVKAHIYDDVPKALEAWTKDAKKVYIYSSGSVEAQKLLFGHSIHGDLLKYFSGYFDTEVGAKQESDSYKNILKKIGEQPSNVVFLTDVVKEAAAAKEAGLLAVIVEREGNAALTDEEKVRYTTIKSFLDLSFQSSSKRAKIEMTDEKNDETTADSGEPMDTSEDIEMSEVTDKKTEKIDGKESEKTQCSKKLSENASTSLAKDGESVAVEKKSSNMEQETPIAEAKETNAKSKDTDGEVTASESAEKITENNITTKDNDKVTEKTEENLNVAKTEIHPTTDDAMDVSLSESTSKSENTLTSSEKKTEDSTNIVKDAQKNEVIDKIQTTENSENTEKTDDAKAQICDKIVADKPEECLAAEKNKIKEDSKAEPKESMDVVAKSEQEEVTKMDTTTDVIENRKPVEAKKEEEKLTVSPKEMEATTSTTESKKETTTPTETSEEKSSETTAESEKVEEKTPQAMETEETTASNVEKTENEAAKQEKGKEEETVKENVVDKKDTNTVDSEKQKLNGAAQNGDTDVPVLDDKLHSNGLNEGQSKETTSEDAAAQNGEPESSSETSAETIKVKKVVDSAVVDAAGEPDVVPPVVVATS